MSEALFVTLLPLGLLQTGALVWILATLKSQLKRAVEDLGEERKHIAVLNDESAELAQRLVRVEMKTSSLQEVAKRIELVLLRLDARSNPRSQ
tara:strand:- start:2979 stop:3257 length:279 start_codon:yes stop_codon:yes gene_type:complete